MSVRLEYVPNDMWIGVYWKVGGPVRSYAAGTPEFSTHRRVDVWICLLPMLPIHATWFQAVVPGRTP